MRVGLFVTCLVDLMRPEIGFSALKLIRDAGYEVIVPPAQTCCGQPAYNSGDRALARDLAEKTLREFEQFDYVVAPSGSCGGMIRAHYGDLFRDDPELMGRYTRLQQKVYELTDFLARPHEMLFQSLAHLPRLADAPTDMPQMRDLHGLPELLRGLRNSGLRPRMSGDGLPMPEIPLPERTAAE